MCNYVLHTMHPKKPDASHTLPASLHPHSTIQTGYFNFQVPYWIQGNIIDAYTDWETTLLQSQTGSEVQAK
jgi:hypothetical protein